MVFENLTLFEIDLENSRFSASRGGESGESGSEETGSDESQSHEAASGEDSSGGRSKALPLGVLLVLVVGALAFRRFRSGGDDGEEAGSADEGGITIEQAAEQ